MSSSSSRPCCPPGSWEGPLDVTGPSEPKGTKSTLGKDLTVYYYTAPVAAAAVPDDDSDLTPLSKKAGIVVFHDVWGLLPRLLSMCDALADKGGFHVIAPDCFRGKTKDDVDDMLGWLKGHPYDEEISEDIQLCLDFLKEKGVQKFGAIGFCWGGWAIAKSAANGVPWSAGVSPHPSTGIEHKVFGRSEEEMMKRVHMPYLLMPAGNDPAHLKPGGATTKEIEKRGGKSVVFEKRAHGWTTRGDLSNPEIKKDTETVLQMALEFFQQHLS